MSWLSSLISGPSDHRDSSKQMQARLRAATRAKLVKNLRDAAQGLATLETRQQQESGSLPTAGGAMGAVAPAPSEAGGVPPHNRREQPLLSGDTTEVDAVCLALEQCLFHRIRVKDFGVIPLWAFLERVERAPLTSGNAGTGGIAGRTGSRERHLSSVRNTVGAVASFTEVATPLGRARAWIRQCLVCKCLESCVAALLEEERLVKVFYEPMALVRCREGSTILLRLCAALEAFDVALNADQSALDTPPRWPILEEEDEWDRRAEASAAASQSAPAAPSRAHAYSSPGQTEATAAQRPQEEQKESLSWFQEQQQRRQREEVAGRSEGGWAASALSEIDQLANGDWNEQLDGVLAKVSSKVDQAVHSLDETINDMFGENNMNNAKGNNSGKQDGWNGWVELDGGAAAPASALLDPGAAAAEAAAAREAAAKAEAARKSGQAASAAAAWATPEAAAATARSPAAGYLGAFVMGSGGRRGGAKGRGRFFGARLEELVVNPRRCQRGMLDPGLGVPDAFLSLVEALSSADCRDTPGLFLREASEEELVLVVKSLDKTNRLPGWDNSTGGIGGHSSSLSHASPAWLVSRLTGGSGGHAEEKTGGRGGTLGGVSPHALASALVYFLHRLPEPLLTFRRREAFLACEAIPDLDARIRNVQLLVEDLPWAHQPLLLALAGLFADIAPQGKHVPAYPRQTPGRDTRTAAKASGQHDTGGGGSGMFLTEGVTVVDETDLDVTEQAGLDVIGDADVIGGVSIRDAAESLAPALLRYPPATAGGVGGEDGAGGAAARGRRPDWEEELAAAAVVELILGEHWRVLEGMRAEQARRERRLSRKVERLTQLTKMLEASVYLERPTHLAVVISIWHRLAQVEHEMLQEAAEGGEEALGLAPSRSWKADSGGELSRLDKNSAGAPPAVVAAAGAGGERKAPEAVDEDRDVRELESMLLDLEAEDDGYDNVPIAEFSAEDNAELSAAAAAADVGEDGAGGPVTHSGGSPDGRTAAAYASAEQVKGESHARALEAAAAGSASDHAPLAFTIEEDDDAVDAQAAAGSGSSPSSRPAPASSSSAAASDYESTRALLGSIADSLTPRAGPGAGAGNDDEKGDSASGGEGLLAATRSELALVSLMEEAGEDPGGLLPTPDDDSCGEPHDRAAGGGIHVPAAAQGLGASTGGGGGGGGIGQRRQPPGRLGSFEDALSTGSTAVGSMSDTAGARAGGESSGNDPLAPIGDGGDGRGGSFRSIGSAQRVPATTKPEASGSGEVDPKEGGAVADKGASFSLGHRRWLTCGFTSAHTVGREGQEAESVGRALRDSASVLALDNMNYFLARYPRSAARAVKSCARRHAAAKGGGDSCPFPVHAGDVTRVIADLLSFQGQQQQQQQQHSARTVGGSAAAKNRDAGVVESAGARALRLAALPTWPLLDSPHAFQEAFSCAVLVMEAAQAAKARDGQHVTMRYEATLLEMRKVLHACLLHAPTSVEAFWAAAAAEGGVSPDPGDLPTGSPSDEAGGGASADVGGGGVGGRDAPAAALRGELERSLGLSQLDLRGEDLPLLGDIAAAVTTAETSGAAASAPCMGGGGTSVDDRVSFRGDATGASPSEGFDDDAHAAEVAATSDWLLAGETARTGMIDSIAAENCGKRRRSGTTLVDDGVFQARLLCPSQILSDAEARALSGHLPGTTRSSDWVSLYSNARHGSSLTTLLARCAGWQPTLVVIEASVPPPVDLGTSGGGGENTPLPPGRTTSGEGRGGGGDVGASPSTVVVFGGFASGSPWKNMGRAFAGDGGSFLFSFSPDTRRAQGGRDNPTYGSEGRDGGGGGGGGGGRPAAGEPGLRVYPWAGSDRCFMTSADEAGVGLGMGGGGDGGNFGFLLSTDLRSGTTGPCETFGNPSLTAPAVASSGSGGGGSTGSVFDVLSVEVWGFRPAKAPEGLTRIAL